ncbi:MAG: hypothetical protein U0414_43375 [Polyangiaceae bacterium]
MARTAALRRIEANGAKRSRTSDLGTGEREGAGRPHPGHDEQASTRWRARSAALFFFPMLACGQSGATTTTTSVASSGAAAPSAPSAASAAPSPRPDGSEGEGRSVAVEPPPKKRCYPPNDGGPRDDGFRTPQYPIYKATISDDGCNLAVTNAMGEMLYIDVATSKILARVRPIFEERDIPTAFIDDARVAFCGDTDKLHFWDGRSQPVDVVKLPLPSPTGCRAIYADRTGRRIALLVGGDLYAEQRKLVVMDHDGKILAERDGVGVSYAAFSGEWFTWFHLPKRQFLHWTDPNAKPVSAWPEGVAFEGLGRGPLGIHGRPPDPIGLEDLSSEAAKNPALPLDRGVPYNGTFDVGGKYSVVFYRADLPTPAKPKAKTGLALFDAAFHEELGFTEIRWASDYVWTHEGETLAYTDSLDVKFIDVPSMKPRGAITAGKP